MRVFYVTCATSWRNPGDKAKGWPWMQRDAMALYTAAESVETLSGVCVGWRILI